MGTLRRKSKLRDPKGLLVNGVILGEPVVLDDGTEIYDDPRIPSGDVDKAKTGAGNKRVKPADAEEVGDVFLWRDVPVDGGSKEAVDGGDLPPTPR